MKQKYQQRKKSSSHIFSSSNINRSMINLRQSDRILDGLKIGLNDRSITKLQKPSKKIIPKYHKFDNFLGWLAEFINEFKRR